MSDYIPGCDIVTNFSSKIDITINSLSKIQTGLHTGQNWDGQ